MCCYLACKALNIPSHVQLVCGILILHAFEQAKERKKQQAAAIAAALPVLRVQPPMTKGDIRVLQLLYSKGKDVPPIRKRALDFGLGLDAACQLEDANILSASELTDANIRMFQSRLKVGW